MESLKLIKSKRPEQNYTLKQERMMLRFKSRVRRFVRQVQGILNSTTTSSTSCRRYLLTERLSRLLLQIDNEKSVVVEVGHDGGAVRLEADAARGVEVLPQVAFEAVLQQELAGRGEKLEGKAK